ncbi:putative nuclease HARBI1 [Maniola jurtina]|uniref:putative nuclease HARBI1 n=1 Tax=Maniola jurtina TaxID=191418 RepID=UPI00156905F5|nr:putative nuclease HARBI1 [Maniola hyperantus]XP_045763464.1 putative nuclease HARBI1 [Maniola jurtina]XP_045783074.1 putative nuclease HARBI1 [Maniola jurtina]
MKRALALAFDDSDTDEEYIVRRPRWIREREQHFDTLDDKDFVTRFRLTKPTVLSVLESIEDKLEFPTNINYSVAPINQLLCALRFYATGCYQVTAADLCGFSTSTAHRIVHRVSAAIASLRTQHIYFPELPDEIRDTQREFYERARFPCVIGAIDCSHVKFIKSPGGENPEIFRNRKHYFSLNVQAICNAKLEFTDVVARWPGSTHDSYIFSNCYRRAMFEQGRYGNAVLVGDAGYACNNYMMTPLDQCNTEAENLYNESHIRTRNCVERLFGVWKRRFPAMAIGLGVSVQHSFPIIIATAVLHNIARRSGETTPPDDNIIINPASWDAILADGNINIANMNAARTQRTNPNHRRRHEFVTNYFAQLER